MREQIGDLWESGKNQVVCITTNSIVKRDGTAIMGAGIAKQARDKFEGIDTVLGNMINRHGNKVHDLGYWDSYRIIAFPTKNDWRKPSELSLIEKSAIQLSAFANLQGLNGISIYLPRPGVGYGQLKWGQVKPVIEQYLDDRFIVVTLDNKYADNKFTLECSSKGDKRFSAFYAKVVVNGNFDSIENHYQLSKRFATRRPPKTWRDTKGKSPDYFEIGDKAFDISLLTAYYYLLWVKYLDAHPELVKYAQDFDSFNDMFRGKSTNCQADCVRDYVKQGRSSIINRPDVQELITLMKSK